MIIGGSGGAVVAAGLAHGLTPQFSKDSKYSIEIQVADFYEEGAKRTFSEKKIGIHRAKYSRKWMKLGYYLIL